MNRRIFGQTLVFAAFGWPVALGAQPARLPRVGVLSIAAPGPAVDRPVWDGLLQGLREHKWVDGQNFVLEVRWASLQPDRLPGLAAELVRLAVDVIVTTGDGEVRAARGATATIPIIMAASGDPVVSGYVASLARPGGNVTGVSFVSPELNPKLLELLREAVPSVSRVSVLWNAGNPVKAIDFREAQRAAQAFGLRLRSVEVRSIHDLSAALPSLSAAGANAVLILVDEFINQHAQVIADATVKGRLPAVVGDRRYAKFGALLSYGPSARELGRRAARYVDAILRGAKPADLPVEQPIDFELVINLKTAKMLGLTLPPALLLRANEILQ